MKRGLFLFAAGWYLHAYLDSMVRQMAGQSLHTRTWV